MNSRHIFAGLFVVVAVSATFSQSVMASTATTNTCYRTSEYTSDSLKAVQTALGVTANGQFGPQSCKALQAFQAKFGDELKVNNAYGYLGPKTAAKLGVVLVQKSATQTNPVPKPLPVKSGTGKRIVVSHSLNWEWLVASDGTIVDQGGIIDNPDVLPSCTYRVNRRIRVNFDKSLQWILNKFIGFKPYGDGCVDTGGTGFHEIPLRVVDGKRMHGEEILGTNKAHSHGCIRQGEALAASTWQFAGIGTLVVVLS